MADVKKEIIKRIFSIAKDNGQSIQLNVIKWGRNSTKYDLRVWDGEKSYKGFTLSEDELKRLCKAVITKYAGSKERGLERVTFDIRQMDAIDLKTILDTYPDSRDDYNRLRAVMRDIYPKKTLEVNLILDVLHCGIVGQMMKLKTVKTRDMNRFVNFMESQYGTKECYTAGAVMAWAKALGITCDVVFISDIEKDGQSLPTSSPTTKPEQHLPQGHKYGNIVFENDDIVVTYKGVYKFNGLFAQGHRIRFFIENKTGQKLKIRGKDISVNDLVVNSDDLFNSEVHAHKKVIDTVLMYQNNLLAAGISKVSDMKSLSIRFEYDNGKEKKLTPEITMIPYEVKE